MKGSWIVAGATGLAACGLVVGAAGSAAAGSQAPGGNNGTIKIEAGPPDDDKANEPHVPCNVYVEFWGYDQGTQTADLEFAAQAPTKGGVVHEDTATWTTQRREGGRHLDHTYGPVDLAAAFARAGIQPAKQGYHVKLTVHVTGSKGADTKHKVFWVEPCAASTTSTTAGATTSTTARSTTTTAGSDGVSTTSSTVAGAVLAGGGTTNRGSGTGSSGNGTGTGTGTGTAATGGLTTAGVDPGVLAAGGIAELSAAAPAELPTRVAGAGGRVGGGSLPRTGAAVGLLALLGAGALGGGELLRRSGRSLRLRRSTPEG